MAAGDWVTITVKVQKSPDNEADPWIPPTADAVAAEIRERLEDVDLDTGWIIRKVSR